MPIYTYTCTACNDVIEKRQSFSDPPLTTCERCGGALRKVIHPVGIVFKGSGWYVTDSRSSKASANGSSSSSNSDGAAPSTPKTASGEGGSSSTESTASSSGATNSAAGSSTVQSE